MLPFFNSFNNEPLKKEVDVIDLSSMQTSVLTKYFPQLGTTKTWDVSVQSSLPINKDDPSEGFITLDRTFQDLSFDPDAYDFDFIKTDKTGVEFYSPTNSELSALQNNPNYISKYNYWLVIQCMTIKEWFSNNSKELDNFNCWEYKEHLYQQEIYFKHKLIHTYKWERPTIPGDTTTPNIGSQGVGLPICNIGAGSTSPTFDENNNKITTGDSPTFETSSGGCRKWKSLSVPFTQTINVRRGLGAVVKLNSSSLYTKVYLKETEDAVEREEVSLGSFEDPILLTKQYLEIEVADPGKSVLKSISIDFYGEEWYRIQLPFKYDEETDYIMHDEETLANTDKFHPPRKLNNEGQYTAPLFKTNFRLNKEFTPIKNFGTRITDNF